MSTAGNLMLAAFGLPAVLGAVALVARHCVYGHAKRFGRAEAARGQAAVLAAEAARRPAREREKVRA